MSTPTAWTQDEIEFLTKEWLAGKSAKNISLELNTGKTRNAVIGKARRLGLSQPRIAKSSPGPAEERPQRKTEKAKPVVKTKKVPPKFFAPRPPLPGQSPIAITELRLSTCRAIVGHDDSIHHLAVYCGDQVFPGKPYCPSHCQLFFRPVEARRMRA